MWILGSHNSWSYKSPKKWWMKPFHFIVRCQDFNIIEQYNLGVRCFDLRIRFNNKSELLVCHGLYTYNMNEEQLLSDLKWIDSKKNCFVRIIHETRNKSQYNTLSINKFIEFCESVRCDFPNIKFWCGKNLYNWENDYNFFYKPSCEEKYSSVCSPKWIDDWYPRWFAKRNNSRIIEEGTNKDILLIDFVNYGYII